MRVAVLVAAAIIRDSETVGWDDWRYCDTRGLHSKVPFEAMQGMPVQAKRPLATTRKRHSHEKPIQKVRCNEVAKEREEAEVLANRHLAMTPLDSDSYQSLALECVCC